MAKKAIFSKSHISILGQELTNFFYKGPDISVLGFTD